MTKRILFVLLMLHVGLAGMWAQEVSEKEAQERAQKFVNSHYGRKGGSSELKSLGQVNGLYVFNMNDKGGFVIVSNDKRTTPILGYSESGTIDPDNMPDVMKAWFQGYADEIAWAQKNIKENSDSNSKVRARTRSHANTTIAPLVTTKWDQLKPYNFYCTPLGKNYRIATGCAATAMAQVMYYTEKKAYTGTEADFPNYTTTTTKEIPSYKWTGNGTTYTLGPIAEGSTIKWGKMTDTYTTTQTLSEESVDAVATLMMYCGYSIKMSYGSSSSAHVSDIAVALKNYFGYSETTTLLERYDYTYTDWVDMIYNELENGRPVLYAGQAVDNGHGFVCDGYMYENNTDLFHINWGWSGSGDGYFVLSVLNPDEQGTGGSATNSAYTFGQEAIVGIQKVSGTGTVLNVKPLKTVSLTINSISLSHSSIALGESVTATVNVTNNGVTKDTENDDYDGTFDGEICLYANNKRYLGKIFQIAKGATQNCVFTISPEVGSYSINAKYPISGGAYYGSGTTASLTVTDQTPSNLTVSDITPTTATIGWTNVGSATNWNLRSRTVNATIEDFNSRGTFDEITQDGWKLVQFGNSNNTLKLSSNGGINNSKCLISPSYENGTDLDPYGGLRTKKLKLDGSISFYAWGEGEKFLLFLSTNGTNYTSFTNTISATNEPTKYSFDLSQYAGQFGEEAYVAIIHCNSSGHTSDSYLYIDNVSFTEYVGQWTKTNNTTSPYILRGLAPETGYEVQVQAVKNDGGKWSAPIIFKSSSVELENGSNNVGLIESCNGYPTTVILKDRTLYKDGKWNTLCLPFSLDATQLAASPLAGADIRALSSGLLSGETLNLYFTPATGEGAVTSITAGTPYIIKWDKVNGYESADPNTRDIKNPVFNGVTIDKTKRDVSFDGGKFVGTYESQTFTNTNTSILFVGEGDNLFYPKAGASIGAQRAYFQIGTNSVRAFNLNFGEGETTGILSTTNLTNYTNSDAWYDLSGRRLNGKPTKKGLYINNGRKVVIK